MLWTMWTLKQVIITQGNLFRPLKFSYLKYSFTNIDTNEILISTSDCLILQN